MSFEIEDNLVVKYSSNIDLLLRQQGSRLRAAVVTDTQIVGTSKFTEQIGQGTARKRTTRHSDTPLTPAEHARRKYDLFYYEYADLIDDEDQVKTLIDPTNAYVMAARDAMNQAMDDEIIVAATGDVRVGKDGTTVLALPTTQKVAVDFVRKGVAKNSGLTVAKLRRASKILRANEVRPDIDPLFIAVASTQKEDLLDDDEVTSGDYNTVRALVRGDIDTYMGFKFIDSERLTLNTTTDVRTCFCWAKSGLELGIGKEPATRVSERDDKSYSVQVYRAMYVGATRLQEKKVIEISCDESP